MVQFWKDHEVFALIENPNWVLRRHDNGVYMLCGRSEAEGVSIGSTVYNLPGHNISNNGEVTYEFIETGDYILKRNEQILTDIDLANIEVQQAITELELMILEG